MLFFGGLHRLQHRQQAIITIALQGRDAVAAQLRARAVHHVVDQLLGQLRRWQVSPRQLQRRAELGHEVPHAGIAAGQGVGQERAHERPAQAGTETDRIVDFSGGRYPVVDQVQGFAPQRFEQAVGNETGHFLAHMQWPHAEGFVITCIAACRASGAVFLPPTTSTSGNR